MTTKPSRGPPFYKGFRRETEVIRKECLFSDWSYAKIGRLVPEQEMAEVLSKLDVYYDHILAIYNYLSALDISAQSNFGVSQLQACNLMIDAGLADDAVTKISDVDRLFISSNVVPLQMRKDLMKGNENTLTRFQFVEFLLRMARQRFLEPRTATSMTDAIERVLKALVPAGAARIAENVAFLSALHTEDVDDAYKRHQGTLQAIHEHFSGHQARAFISLASFYAILDYAEAYNAEFQVRKAGVAFRMGMRVEVDEVHHTRFQEMSFVEFQHAIGAVAFFRVAGKPEQMVAAVEELLGANLAKAWAGLRKAKKAKLTKKGG